MSKYRKKPVVIEAMQFTEETLDDCYAFVTCQKEASFDSEMFGSPILIIHTMEGAMTARLNDWIVKGVASEFYPVKDSIFRETYEAVSDDAD